MGEGEKGGCGVALEGAQSRQIPQREDDTNAPRTDKFPLESNTHGRRANKSPQLASNCRSHIPQRGEKIKLTIPPALLVTSSTHIHTAYTPRTTVQNAKVRRGMKGDKGIY